jgi:general secretion pathway protein D
MKHMIVGIPCVVLMAASVFSEVISTAEDYAVDSDVVLESIVREVKSIPQDTANIVGDVVKFTKDEILAVSNGVAAAFEEEDAHSKVQRAGELEVANAWDSGGDIQFRSYKVSEKVGDLLQAYVENKSAPAINVADFFKSISFPENTSVRYLPEFQSLFVRQTPDNLLAMEKILASYQDAQKNRMGHQVEIEAKFIEVSQSTLDELGFNWEFTGKNGGPLRLLNDLYLPAGTDLLSGGLRNAAASSAKNTPAALAGSPAAGTLNVFGNSGSIGLDLTIQALEQANDSDVLSAPRVVTHSGQEATIAVGEDRMVPKSFEIENQETSPYVQNADWEQQLMGVQMAVTPQIRLDGLIDLTINSQILDIIGYDSYEITPKITGGGPYVPFTPTEYVTRLTFQVPEITQAEASLPYFRIRKLETRATVADGSTIGMGGLIYDKLETFRDKVPVLGSIPLIGRLFRSEGERSVKRNLMIFVTATQVDVDGRRKADLALQK